MPQNATTEARSKREREFKIALLALLIFTVFGDLFVGIYAYRNQSAGFPFWSVLAVGLMAGGAASSAGALLGFLFGVPYSREQTQEGSSPAETPGSHGRRGERDLASQYRPNTSLEQISDWLTKMLVGVGLVELKDIRSTVHRLATFLAKGLGGSVQAEVFAATMLAYFSVSGFLLGFLWARLYLPKWFRWADELDDLQKKVSEIDEKLEANARALTLATRQITRSADLPPIADETLQEAIKAALSATRQQILSIARETYERRRSEKKTDEEEIWLQGVISVLRALIASEPDNQLYHAQLSYALLRNGAPKEAAHEITKAIEIRTRMNRPGWKWYEFHKARCLMAQEPNYTMAKSMNASLVQDVKTNLSEAFKDSKNWKGWVADNENARKWMELNAEAADPWK